VPAPVASLLRVWGGSALLVLFLVFGVVVHVTDNVTFSALISSVVVLGLTAVASTYVRHRLHEVVAQFEREAVRQRRADLALRSLHVERITSTGSAAARIAHELDMPLTCVLTNLTLIGERLSQTAETGSGETLHQLDQAVTRAATECHQLILGFAARLPSEHRHAFNNAIMPLSYALDKAAKRIAALRMQDTGGVDGVQALLEEACASAQLADDLVRELGRAAEVPAVGL
jgi:hypothetical protein